MLKCHPVLKVWCVDGEQEGRQRGTLWGPDVAHFALRHTTLWPQQARSACEVVLKPRGRGGAPPACSPGHDAHRSVGSVQSRVCPLQQIYGCIDFCVGLICKLQWVQRWMYHRSEVPLYKSLRELHDVRGQCYGQFNITLIYYIMILMFKGKTCSRNAEEKRSFFCEA